ncbi:MAG: contact-dependent growth inhibition system immunity protein [Cardiobacteriaceae bacterium]|nr:contact-dependent growth inhibition system immunity protein [Cardiobacteriaceae bacterium]
MFQTDQRYAVTCYANNKAIIIQTDSGFRMLLLDHMFPPDIFDPDVEDEVLGKAVLRALANSRTFVYGTHEYKDFFDQEKGQQLYEQWVALLCKELGYKNKGPLFRKMKNCGIRLCNGAIVISPMKHVRGDAWDGMAWMISTMSCLLWIIALKKSVRG